MGRIDKSTTSSNNQNQASASIAASESTDTDNSTAATITELNNVDDQLIELSAELKKLQLKSYELADKISYLSLTQHRLNTELAVKSADFSRRNRARNRIAQPASVSATTVTTTPVAAPVLASPVNLFPPAEQDQTANIATPNENTTSSSPSATTTPRHDRSHGRSLGHPSIPLRVGTSVKVLNSYLGKKGVTGTIIKVMPAYYHIKPTDGEKPFRRHHNNVQINW